MRNFVNIKIISAVVGVAMAYAFSAGAASASPRQPAASTSPSASAAGTGSSVAPTSSPVPGTANRPIPFHGVVVAVDQSAKTFTISGKQKSHIFKVTDHTVIIKAAQNVTMKEIHADEEVSGSYWKQADGSLEAKTVKVGPINPSKPAKPSATPSPSASPKKP